MERKDEQQQKDMPQDVERPMAQRKDEGKRKPDADKQERDETVGKVPDPQGEDQERKRDQP
jgi:hypothetical protein